MSEVEIPVLAGGDFDSEVDQPDLRVHAGGQAVERQLEDFSQKAIDDDLERNRKFLARFEADSLHGVAGAGAGL